MGIFARTKSILIVAALFFTVAASVYVFLCYQIKARGGSLVVLKQNLLEETQRGSELKARERLLEELKDEEQSLDARFVSARGVVPFIELLESVAKDTGVAIEIVSVGIEPSTLEGEGKKDAWYEWLKVAMKVEGSWAGLFRFVRLIETLPFATELSQVGLEAPEEGVTGWQGTFILRAVMLTEEN